MLCSSCSRCRWLFQEMGVSEIGVSQNIPQNTRVLFKEPQPGYPLFSKTPVWGKQSNMILLRAKDAQSHTGSPSFCQIPAQAEARVEDRDPGWLGLKLVQTRMGHFFPNPNKSPFLGLIMGIIDSPSWEDAG